MDAYERAEQNTQKSLHLIDRFGWLRPQEVGVFLWPDQQPVHQRTMGHRLAKKLLDARLLIERKLPNGAGRALVLSERGARLLREQHGVEAAQSGKDWGSGSAGDWTPPNAWRHDLMAAGFLAHLVATHGQQHPDRDIQFWTEREIRKNHPNIRKIPDGLLRIEALSRTETGGIKTVSSVQWLELESARKSGANMQHLAAQLCAVAEGNAPTLMGQKPTRAAVVYDPDARDERGHRLNHLARLTAALRQHAGQPLQIRHYHLHLSNRGAVERVTLDPNGERTIQIEPNQIRIMPVAVEAPPSRPNESGQHHAETPQQQIISHVWHCNGDDDTELFLDIGPVRLSVHQGYRTERWHWRLSRRLRDEEMHPGIRDPYTAVDGSREMLPSCAAAQRAAMTAYERFQRGEYDH